MISLRWHRMCRDQKRRLRPRPVTIEIRGDYLKNVSFDLSDK